MPDQFHGAHHFGIQKFNANTTYITQVQSPPTDQQAFSILSSAQAVEATHASKTASYAPKITPGTRTKVIQNIFDWVGTSGEGASSPTSILWFSGPAGAGKTCIMRDVVTQCQDAGHLTASYFFSTRVPGLDSEHPFVATIAHQLVQASPHLRSSILEVISHNTAIFDYSLDHQMGKLVVDALKSEDEPSNTTSPRKVVVAIDGFDECRCTTEREHLLGLFSSLAEAFPPSRLVIILASRPELDIRTAFDSRHFKPITHVIRLQDYDGNEDIRIFFCDEFEKIRENHPMKHLIPYGWPVEAILNILIDKASGNFIYPATLIKYVNNPRKNPVLLLEHVLSFSEPTTSTDTNPLAELDALYTLILHPPNTDIRVMKRLLHCILGVTRASGRSSHIIRKYETPVRSPSFFDEFLQLSPGTTVTAIIDLHSVISVPSEDKSKSIGLHHKSLEDYLVSPGRSLDLFQARRDTDIEILCVCTQHLKQWMANPRSALKQSTLWSATCWDSMLYTLCEERKESLRQLYHGSLSAPLSPSQPLLLPDTIFQFDPRVISRFAFVFDTASLEPRLGQSLFHETVCEDCGACTRLCGILKRMDRKYLDEAYNITMRHLDKDPKARAAALGRFDEAAGLADPLDIVPQPLSRPFPPPWPSPGSRLPMSFGLDGAINMHQPPNIRPHPMYLTMGSSNSAQVHPNFHPTPMPPPPPPPSTQPGTQPYSTFSPSANQQGYGIQYPDNYHSPLSVGPLGPTPYYPNFQPGHPFQIGNGYAPTHYRPIPPPPCPPLPPTQNTIGYHDFRHGTPFYGGAPIATPLQPYGWEPGRTSGPSGPFFNPAQVPQLATTVNGPQFYNLGPVNNHPLSRPNGY